MAFDEKWKSMHKTTSGKSLEEKLKIVMDALTDHPFLLNEPKEARNVAFFRIKLLNLD